MKTPFPWRGALAAAAHYTAAFLATTLLHELGHALVSKALGGQPVLYHSAVNSRNAHLPAGSAAAIALAGPVLSLGQGVLFLAWAWRRRGAGDAALWRLYLGLFGIINFLGYLLIGPVVPYGDIGQAEALWHVPVWARVAVAVAAGFGMHLLVGRTAPLFVAFGPGLARPQRGQLMRALVAVPWLLGSVLITVLTMPWPTPISLLYPVMSNMVLGAAWGGAMRLPYSAAAAPGVPLRVSLSPGWAVAALAVAGAVCRLLAPGVAL